MKPRVIVVLGPWSSGTSALAGIAAALGVNAHPPWVDLTDPRTPVSFESRELRRIVLPAFDHETVHRTGTPPHLMTRLRLWAGPGLSMAKLPQLAFFVPEMLRAWDTRLVMSERPLVEIEASRRRRGWAAEYGEMGARRILAEIEANLPADAPVLRVAFAEVKADPTAVARHMAAFAGIDPPADLSARLAAVVRSERRDI